MGVIWKFKMTLLSTLAALVIIAHSAEENYERNYREIRSRSMDVAPPSYDQSLMAVEVEPTTSTLKRNQAAWDSDNQPMRRRRRKRKRRPQQSQDELSIPGFIYQEGSQAQQQDAIEMPRRRRKKIDHQNSRERSRPDHWNGEEQPLRRGQRRKRPPVESWPVLSEFNVFRQHDRPDSSEEITNDKNTQIDTNMEDNEYDIEAKEQIESKVKLNYQNEPKIHKPNEHKDVDGSLSEFSSEFMSPKPPNTTSIKEKYKDKIISISNDVKMDKEKRPLDPFMLKAILKKSNGKSLSEILQRNNLSLADLLNGKESALSVLQMKDDIDSYETSQIKTQSMYPSTNSRSEDKSDIEIQSEQKEVVEKNDGNRKEKADVKSTTDYSSSIEIIPLSIKENNNNLEAKTTEVLVNSTLLKNTTQNFLRRRFPVGIRRKLRMRPTSNNTTYKGQLSRDLITLTSLKYKNKTLSKSKEWKDIIPVMIKRGEGVRDTNINDESISIKIITTTFQPEETTTDEVLATTTESSNVFINTETSFDTDSDKSESLNTADSKRPGFKVERLPSSTDIDETLRKDMDILIEDPKNLPVLKPLVNSSELRKQVYNNRLKRKRFQQKVSTTELPDEQGLKDIYGTANYVSASEFIAETQTTKTDLVDDYSTLEDFITTEPSKSTDVGAIKSSNIPQRNNKVKTFSTPVPPITTGETAKYEIEEILSDNLASARLSKILKERNMTLGELVEHRERGSSHVHLADIFHNSSKEPNPPEPFLSKSFIEPISKETYPLRALLEANSYDPKTTTVDTNSNPTNNLNIPVIMDFGNNVNENSENMGILSLFTNFSGIQHIGQNDIDESEKIIDRYDGTDNTNKESAREGRILDSEKDLISLNDLLSFLGKNNHRENLEDRKQKIDARPIPETFNKINLEEDTDGDSLTVLEDLQKLKDFDSRITSDELLEIKMYETNESTQTPVTNTSSNSNTKSVAVATASIIGLSLILFLLTYTILKWKQQTKMFHNKHAKEDECVPTPIFENRKGHRINSSTRSKSPMLSSPNIYTIDTIDTHAGNESPEYMWDTLRKPFQ